MNDMEEKIKALQNEAIDAAAQHIREQRRRNANARLSAVCLTVLLCVAILCATALGLHAISAQQKVILEQQYALNMQYAGLLDYLKSAEITSETITREASASGGGTAVAGDGNLVAGGDLNGEG